MKKLRTCKEISGEWAQRFLDAPRTTDVDILHASGQVDALTQENLHKNLRWTCVNHKMILTLKDM